MIRRISTFAAAVGLFSANAPAAVPVDTPAAIVEADKARRIAADDLTTPLFLCQPQGGGVVRATLERDSGTWVTPTKAFDNLFFVGNGFVGVWVLKTSEGLILFDSGQSEAEARDHIAPGLEQLGLDPKAIRYVIVTHGHWDHFGDAAKFTARYYQILHPCLLAAQARPAEVNMWNTPAAAVARDH